MAIILITGLPGHGKTHYTINMVRSLVEGSERPVYSSGVVCLEGLDWIPVDSKEWNKCPAGSVVVIDEAQNTFPVMKSGSDRPDYYSLLNTHRHLGIDLYLVTQNSMLLDSTVRRLADQHINLSRVFGKRLSVVWTFQGAVNDVKDYFARKTAVRSYYRFPAFINSLYKSTELDTIKPFFPKKVVLISVLVLLFFLFCGVLTYWLVGRLGETDESVLFSDLSVIDDGLLDDGLLDLDRDSVIDQAINFPYGVFSGKSIFYVGNGFDVHNFNVEGLGVIGRKDLESLGYVYNHAFGCFGFIDDFFVGCDLKPLRLVGGSLAGTSFNIVLVDGDLFFNNSRFGLISLLRLLEFGYFYEKYDYCSGVISWRYDSFIVVNEVIESWDVVLDASYSLNPVWVLSTDSVSVVKPVLALASYPVSCYPFLPALDVSDFSDVPDAFDDDG